MKWIPVEAEKRVEPPRQNPPLTFSKADFEAEGGDFDGAGDEEWTSGAEEWYDDDEEEEEDGDGYAEGGAGSDPEVEGDGGSGKLGERFLIDAFLEASG